MKGRGRRQFDRLSDGPAGMDLETYAVAVTAWVARLGGWKGPIAMRSVSKNQSFVKQQWVAGTDPRLVALRIVSTVKSSP